MCIKDPWTKPKGEGLRVGDEGGWGRGKRWWEKGDNYTWTTTKKKYNLKINIKNKNVVWVLPKMAFNFNNSLEGLTGLRNLVYRWLQCITVLGYGVKISKGKICTGQNPGNSRHRFTVGLSQWGHADSSSSTSNNVCRYLWSIPIREVHSSLGFQGFIWP